MNIPACSWPFRLPLLLLFGVSAGLLRGETGLEEKDAFGPTSLLFGDTTTCSVSLGPDTALCSGASLTLDPGPGITFSWSTGDTTSTLLVNTSGSYAITVTDATGCAAADTISIVINPNPTPTAAATPPAVCVGATIALIANGGQTYAWSGPAGFSSALQNPQRPNAAQVMAGVYTVTATDGNGCTATATASVAINSNPAATATVMPAAVCPGGAFTLNAAGGSVFAWTGPGGFSSNQQTVQRMNATTIMGGVYTVTVTNSAGCSATATTLAVVNPLPPAVASTGTPNLCSGETISLTASGGVQYAWSGPGGFTSAQQNPQRPDATAAMAGVYTVTVTDANGCTATANTTVTVLAAPLVTLQHSNVHCGQSDGTIDLTISGAPPFLIDWADLPGPNNPEDRANLSAGNYAVTVSDANGCSAMASVLVKNLLGPDPVAVPKPATCGQPNGAIDLVLTAGTPPFAFIWSNGAMSEDLFGLPTGPYGMTVTDAGGCTNSTSTYVYGPAPLTATDIIEDCQGTDNAYVVSCTLTGGTPPFTLVAGSGTISGNQFSSQPVTSGVAYSFSIRDSAGCPPLVVSGLHDCNCLTNPGTMDQTLLTTCGGAPVVAQHHHDQFLPPGAVLLFVLHQGSGASLANPIAWNTVPVFSFTGGITYGVTYYISAIAGQSDSMGGIKFNDPCLAVAPGTPVQFVLGYENNVSDAFCAGSSYQVGSNTYTTPGTYTVPLKSVAGCDSIIHLTLEMRQPGVSLGSSVMICASDSVQLNAQAIGCLGCQYTWSIPGANTPSRTVAPATTTTYSVTVTDDVGCTAQSIVKINVGQTATTELESVICTGSAYSVGGLSFSESGDYEVHLLTSAGCDSTVFLMLDVIEPQVYAALADTFFYPPGSGISEQVFDLIQNDQLPGTAWETTLGMLPVAGQAQVSADGRLTYRLVNTSFQGLDSLTYRLCDIQCTDTCVTASVVLVVQNGLLELTDSLPNAFTPNGDGYNDTFDPVGLFQNNQYIAPASRISLSILNRWGELVWQADPYAPWEGRSGSGSLVPQGTYYYMLRMELGQEIVVKGAVQVLRE